jgi:hypothetical protein
MCAQQANNTAMGGRAGHRSVPPTVCVCVCMCVCVCVCVTDLVCCDGEFFDGGHGILQVLFLRLLPLELPFQTLHFGRETRKPATAREAAMAESGWMSVCLSECAAPFEFDEMPSLMRAHFAFKPSVLEPPGTSASMTHTHTLKLQSHMPFMKVRR